MRILSLICVFLAALSHGAFAIRANIPQAEIDAINVQIGVAQGMDSNIRLAKTKYDEAASRVESTEADRLALKAKWEREKSKQSAAFTVAIHMAIVTYDLNPNKASGTSVMRQTKGRAVVWLPVAGEGEDRTMQSVSGKLRDAVKPLVSFDGLTSSDGVTFITRAGFDKGANCLASTLFHERIHFELFTTDGKGNAMSRAEREEEALTSQLNSANYFFDPVKDKDFINQIRTKLRTETKKVQQEKGLPGMIRRLLPSENQPDMSESMIRTETELADISGLVAKARSQADIARRDREKREARAQAAAEEEARRDHDQRLRDALLDMARRSCSSPGSVEQWELDDLPVPYDNDFVRAYPQGADDCFSRAFYSLFRGADAEELRRKSTTTVAADARVSVPPAALAVAKNAFHSNLRLLQYYAVDACRTTERVPLNTELTDPREPVEFDRERDDRAAERLATGLGKCETLLFRKLIEMIRSGQEPLITAEWVQGAAAIYRAAPDPSSGFTPPSGGGRAPRCEDYGNINCP